MIQKKSDSLFEKFLFNFQLKKGISYNVCQSEILLFSHKHSSKPGNIYVYVKGSGLFLIVITMTMISFLPFTFIYKYFF